MDDQKKKNPTRARRVLTAGRLAGTAASLLAAALLDGPSVRAQIPQSRRFHFGSGPSAPGAVMVAPAIPYAAERGYGFELGSSQSGQPFFFSVRAGEGNVRVRVTVGGAAPSATTIRAELRRLMIERVVTAAGGPRIVEFVVNLRTPRLPGGDFVRLKPREKTGEAWDWDERLTLEFDGDHPCISDIELSPAGPLPTVYLAGDSTVCDQPYEPFASWGQMLTRFFGPHVAVANHAESGESLHSFIAEKRLSKLDGLMRPGDYLFIQFGHNDQKEKGPGVGAMTSYKRDLERFVADARAHGATPVLITAVSRRSFGVDGRIANSLGQFPAAVRLVAREQGVPLIDLNAMSAVLYESFGPERAQRLFPTVRGKVEATHHNDFGSYELARCIVEGIRKNRLGLVAFLSADAHPFDPAHPDDPDTFDLPASPMSSDEKPYGN